MLASHAVAPGERLVVFTNNDSGYETALAWHRIGRAVTVVDARSAAQGARRNAAQAAGIDIRAGCAVRRGAWAAGMSAASMSRQSVAAARSSGSTAICWQRPVVGTPWCICRRRSACGHGLVGSRPRLSARNSACRRASRRRHQRPRVHRGMLARRLPRRCPGRGAGGFRCSRRAGCTQHRRTAFGPRPSPLRGAPCKALPRVQAVRGHAARRHRRRHRTRGPRRLPLGRARQALHRARLRHGPRQARQRQWRRHSGEGPRAGHRGDRNDDVPPALHAGVVRRGGGPGCGRVLRPRAANAHARVARGARRGLGGCGAVEASVVLPQERRKHGRGRATRMLGGTKRRRHARCLHARQDRRAGAGRGAVPGSHIHQRLSPPCRGALPLRPHAARGRLHPRRRRDRAGGREPLPDAHHHRQRRSGALVARALAADRMAGAQTCI